MGSRVFQEFYKILYILMTFIRFHLKLPVCFTLFTFIRLAKHHKTQQNIEKHKSRWQVYHLMTKIEPSILNPSGLNKICCDLTEWKSQILFRQVYGLVQKIVVRDPSQLCEHNLFFFFSLSNEKIVYLLPVSQTTKTHSHSYTTPICSPFFESSFNEL